jgi:hypothetical protein
MIMAAPSNGKQLDFDNLLMVFAQRGSAIIPARIGDLRTGTIPGGQFYVRQIYTSHQVHDGLTQIHTQQGAAQIQEIHDHLATWPAGDSLTPFTFLVCPRLVNHRTHSRRQCKGASATPSMHAAPSKHTRQQKYPLTACTTTHQDTRGTAFPCDADNEPRRDTKMI